MKILVVDDCQTTRKLLGLYLKAKGYEVAVAENGLDAIEKLGKESVTLVLTALNMPYMDGIELIKTLRADPSWVNMPILMVTTESDSEEREKAFKAGANGYLVKPVSADMVSQHISRILKDMFIQGDVSDV